MRKILLWAMVVVALTAGVAQAARPLPKAELLAVYVYADWCPNCKILSPEIDAARKMAELDKKNVLFVPLNLTDKASIHQSILLAQVMGIGEFLQAQGSGTGYMALLDAQTKQELLRFDRDSKAAKIAEEIEKRLKKE